MTKQEFIKLIERDYCYAPLLETQESDLGDIYDKMVTLPLEWLRSKGNYYFQANQARVLNCMINDLEMIIKDVKIL